MKESDPSRIRPNTVDAAVRCIPPDFAKVMRGKVFTYQIADNSSLVFESLELAVRMEAAFWLERQYRTASLHWYQQDLRKMVRKLVDASHSIGESR